MILAGPCVVPSLRYNVPSYVSHLNVIASNQQSQKPEPNPRRITSNVKQNLMYLKILKEMKQKAASSSSKPATSYRKKKVEKVPDDLRSYEDPTLKLYHTNEGWEIATPVLLVDGYNLCGYWPKLKKHFSKGDLDTARHKLIEEMIRFSAVREVKVVVVFDATLSGLTTHKETTQNVDVVYTVDTCADSWIEKEGAYIWNCRVLISEIKDAKKELEEMLHDETMYSVKGKLLEHNLDPEVLDALQTLKQQLKGGPG